MIIRSLHWYAIQQDTFSGTNESSRRQLVHAETPHRGWQFRRRMFASNNPSQLRQKNIDHMLRVVKGIHPSLTDPSEFIIPLSASQGGSDVSLIVSLPEAFPAQPPILALDVNVVHPWVNDHRKVVGHPRLRSWGVHYSLGKVVLEVCEEFKKNPLQRASTALSVHENEHSLGSDSMLGSDNKRSSPSSSVNYSNQSNSYPYSAASSSSYSEAIQPLQVPSTFSFLSVLDQNAIASIEKDQDRREAIILSLPAVQQLIKLKRDLESAVATQATGHVSWERDLKVRVEESIPSIEEEEEEEGEENQKGRLRHEYNKAVAAYQEAAALFKRQQAENSPAALLIRLGGEVQRLEKMAEDTRVAFVENNNSSNSNSNNSTENEHGSMTRLKSFDKVYRAQRMQAIFAASFRDMYASIHGLS